MDVTLHVIIFMNGNFLLISFYVEEFGEIVFPAKLSVLRRSTSRCASTGLFFHPSMRQNLMRASDDMAGDNSFMLHSKISKI